MKNQNTQMSVSTIIVIAELIFFSSIFLVSQWGWRGYAYYI